MADPGFPVGGGGVDLVRGAVDPRSGYVSKILHVKTKESGPVGGGARRACPPPRSANASHWVFATATLRFDDLPLSIVNSTIEINWVFRIQAQLANLPILPIFSCLICQNSVKIKNPLNGGSTAAWHRKVAGLFPVWPSELTLRIITHKWEKSTGYFRKTQLVSISANATVTVIQW